MAEREQLIEKANKEYYTLDNPSVTDREYDNWMSELIDIENKIWKCIMLCLRMITT